MRKILLPLFAAIVTLLCPVAAMAQTKVVFAWTNGNTGTNVLPVCPATNPTSCVSGYRLSMDGTQVAGESNIGPTLTTYTQTPLPAVGNHSYSLVMVGFDATGTAIASSAATTTVNVAAPVTINPPSGFKATAQ